MTQVDLLQCRLTISCSEPFDIYGFPHPLQAADINGR